jgi:hypothetical protein
MRNAVSALIGFGSAILAIVLTPWLQNHFWRRQRHAELSLAVIERCAKLIYQLWDRLPKIQGGERTDADIELLRRWGTLSLEIRALFSASTYRRFSKLTELILKYSNPLPSGGFRISDFDAAQIEAISALYEEIGLTGQQIAEARWWRPWSL